MKKQIVIRNEIRCGVEGYEYRYRDQDGNVCLEWASREDFKIRFDSREYEVKRIGKAYTEKRSRAKRFDHVTRLANRQFGSGKNK